MTRSLSMQENKQKKKILVTVINYKQANKLILVQDFVSEDLCFSGCSNFLQFIPSLCNKVTMAVPVSKEWWVINTIQKLVFQLALFHTRE